MNPDRPSQTAKTFWFRPGSDVFYLIPQDVDLPPGELELRSLHGARCLVDEAAASPWIANVDALGEHLAQRAHEGIRAFIEEIGAAWRRGLAEAGSSVPRAEQDAQGAARSSDESGDAPAAGSTTAAPTAPELLRAAERAEASARVIDAAAARVARALKELAEQLEVASRRASEHTGDAPSQHDDDRAHEGNSDTFGSH